MKEHKALYESWEVFVKPGATVTWRQVSNRSIVQEDNKNRAMIGKCLIYIGLFWVAIAIAALI